MADRLCVRDDPLLGMLVLMIAVLGGFAVWSGWMWQGSAPPELVVTTVRGDTVALFGEGAYRYNSVFHGWAFRAQDAVMALALLVALWSVLFMRGARALAVLMAVLGYVLYAYASTALSAALDWLLPLYVLLLSLSFFALWRAGRGAVAGFERPGLPGAGLAGFLALAGIGTLTIWAPALLADVAGGRTPPRLGMQTTPVTHVQDLALVAPLSLVAAVLVLRGRPLGHMIALPLIGCILFLLPTILLATLLQVRAGIVFTPPEWIGPIGAFAALGLLAGWFLRYYLLVLRAA
jgi:hypothetical protein